MPIDPNAIVWDDEPAAPPPAKVDPNLVRWDQPEPDNSLAQWAGVANRALAPYATAATLGGAAAAPTGVGIPFGAGGGVAALGLSDLATLGYNALAPAMGKKRVPLPSQTIQKLYERAGVARAPTTPTQQLFSDVLEGAASGGLTAKSLSAMAPRYSGTTQRILNVMAAQPKAQMLAGAGGAALPSAAANYAGVEDPLALAGLGYAGGLLAGKPGVKQDRGPSMDQLRSQADAAYAAAKNAGMVFPNQNFATLTADIGGDLARQGFNRRLHPKVAAVLDQFNREVKTGGDFGLDNLDVLRRVAKSAAGSFDRDERRLGRMIVEKLDNFIMEPRNVSAGSAPEGAFALKKARELWARKARTEIFDDAVQAAYNKTQTSENPPALGVALRSEFRKIADNPKRMKGFSPEEQKYIREIAGGSPSNKALRFVASWLTPNSLRGLAAEAGIATSMLPFLGPQGMAVALGTSLMGGLSKKQANAMTVRQIPGARNVFASGQIATPRRNYVMLPSTAQAAQAQKRREDANRLRQQYNLPAWAVRPE